jgi:hypothetical protein
MSPIEEYLFLLAASEATPADVFRNILNDLSFSFAIVLEV